MEHVPDNECNLHGPFHGIVCSICFNIAKGASVLASNPPNGVDHSYTGTLEREIERLLIERRSFLGRLSTLEKVVEAARGVAQWSDACWTGGYAGNQPHPAWGDVQELRAAIEAAKE